MTEPAGSKPDFAFRFNLFDVRDLDGDELLASPNIEDNVLALLTRLHDNMTVVREILLRMWDLDQSARKDAFAQFLLISKLRGLALAVKQEAEKMPFLNDILDHEVIGPAIRQGLEQGLAQGLEQGLEQGLARGRHDMLKGQLQKRFGKLPAWVEPRLAKLSIPELDAVALRIFDVTRLEELLP